MRPNRDALWIAGLTLAFEAVTCLLRFGFGIESTRDTLTISSVTSGIRIHHSYIGLLMILISLLLPRGRAARSWCLRIGGALLMSDLIHHFLVLWITQGCPQFDLTYPK